ncbi:MAG TPA: DoxX family protein [Phaeodactylibacter sp.]|nr:DoxX family protein [Phaeodactylibacter sp.]
MSLMTIFLYVAIVAALLTAFFHFGLKRVQNPGLSFLQNFAGALFVFSGFVKVVDPLGTAYKLEEYFAEFESLFQHTWFSFLSPVFPWMGSHAVGFSVFVIILEIVLGIMLIIGAAPRFTARAFFLLILFFTALTGFTYLTGYVPEGATFFEFGKWGKFAASNMKVTDCGCFGDFIKLSPKTSFFKDVFLLIPALIFLFGFRQMHQLFNTAARTAITGISAVALLFYAWSNYKWNLPDFDFRPFKVGVDIAEQKALEAEAQANVKILAYRMTNKETGEVVQLSYDDYMKDFKKYPKEKWDLEQVRSEPEIAPTKISDFEFSDADGNDVTEEFLGAEGTHYLIVAVKLPYEKEVQTITRQDTLFVVDTVQVAPDSIVLQRKIGEVKTIEEEAVSYRFDEDYLKRYDAMLKLADKALQEGKKVHLVTAYNDPAVIEAFKKELGISFPVYLADDILLKTIIRSNPGLVEMDGGKITGKWHYRPFAKKFGRQ